MFGRYHVTEPSRFYDGSANVAGLARPRIGSRCRATDFGALTDVGSSDTAANAAAAGGDLDRAAHRSVLPLPQAPGGRPEHFIVPRPFVPVSSGNSQTRLVSFLTANSDPGQYGELAVVHDAAGRDRRGPGPGEQRHQPDGRDLPADHAAQPQGSRVIQGSLQLIPVGNSILIYVRPFYVQGRQSGSFPQFQFVVVYSAGPRCGLRADGHGRPRPLVQRRDRRPRATLADSGPGRGTGDADHDDHDHHAGYVHDHAAAPTTTTVPATTGSVRDLLNQAAGQVRPRPTAALDGGRPRHRTSALEQEARAPRGPGPDARALAIAPPGTSGLRDCSGSQGIVTIDVVEIPATPCGEPQ